MKIEDKDVIKLITMVKLCSEVLRDEKKTYLSEYLYETANEIQSRIGD